MKVKNRILWGEIRFTFQLISRYIYSWPAIMQILYAVINVRTIKFKKKEDPQPISSLTLVFFLKWKPSGILKSGDFLLGSIFALIRVRQKDSNSNRLWWFDHLDCNKSKETWKSLSPLEEQNTVPPLFRFYFRRIMINPSYYCGEELIHKNVVLSKTLQILI